MFDLLDERERRALLQVGIRRRFSPGEVVFHEGDPGDALHFVTHGAFIARSSSTMGELIGVNVFGVGDVFGEMALLNSCRRRTATVVSHGRGATLMIARTSFDALRATHTNVDRVLVAVLAERNRSLTANLVELLFTPVEQRVCRQLLAFSRAVAPATPDGWVAIRQADLATLAGATRSTVNRVLRRAADRGLVELARGRIRLADEPALRAFAGVRDG
ncbi:MAG TPA: Crp/Fnr family transcriptional regulator [Acidimicrobiales bacterium]|nr:Crp/Fnr family transcriptional regulator [Acidimicrobiales bacterium]